MKKLILPFVLILGTTMILGFVFAECTDSDNGKNYYVSGVAKTINISDGSVLDSAGESCVGNSNQVIESYCIKGELRVRQEYYNCPNGCQDGACVVIFHSADMNHDWVISGTEFNRVAAYWRAGGYYCNSEGLDGYAPGEGIRNCAYHSADYNKDWKIDNSEYLRVKVYWEDPNGYVINSEGFDGFAACSSCPNGCQDGACIKGETNLPGKITIRGKVVDSLTNKVIRNARLGSAYVFEPNEVVTDSNGNFEFIVDTNFNLKDGSENFNEGFGATFYTDCYDYGYIGLQKNYEPNTGSKLDNGKLFIRNNRFDQEEYVQEVTTGNIVDVGTIKMYPNADISIESDIPTSFNVMYKYKNLQGYNGPGQSGYTREHYLSSALPLDYDVFIQFQDEAGKEYKSTTYRIPLNAKCGVVSLKYSNGESEWSILSEVKPTEESGPVKIEIPEVVKKENPTITSRLCFGCLKSETCYPLGYRKAGEYCSESKTFIVQLEPDSTCDNNFECSSNVCISGKCISESFIQKIINWFKRLFGGE